mgnify:CR=1 FL=1
MKTMNLRLWVLFGALIWSVGACSSSEASPATGEATPRTIHTNGVAQISVIPDRAELSFGVETRDEDLEVARKANDERITKLQAAIRKLGVSSEHVKTGYMSITPQYKSASKFSSGVRLDGFRMYKEVLVTLDDPELANELVAMGIEAGATHVNNLTFRSSEDRKHRDHARAMALQAAREKAEMMAKELGQSIGRPIQIVESQAGFGGSSHANFMNNQQVQMGGVPEVLGTIAPGALAIQAQVMVTFELK